MSVGSPQVLKAFPTMSASFFCGSLGPACGAVLLSWVKAEDSFTSRLPVSHALLHHGP